MSAPIRVDVLLVVDQRGQITSCISSLPDVLGWAPEALVGQNVRCLVPNPDAERHDDYMARYLEHGVTRVLNQARTVEVLHRSGQHVSANLSVSPVPTGDGVVYAATIRDLRTEGVIDQLTRSRDGLAVQSRVNQVVQEAADMESLCVGVLNALVAMPELTVEAKGGIFLMETPATHPDALPVYGQSRGLRLAHAVGDLGPAFVLNESVVPMGGCLCGRAAVSGDAIVSANCDTDPRHDYRLPGMTPHGHYIIPLRADGDVIGVLFLYTDVNPESGPARITLLETIGSQIGLAIRRLQTQAELERLAHEDPLTGLMNRRAVLGRLDAELDRGRRYQTATAVIMLDGDHFKRVNDSHGHLAGDAVLATLARRMERAVRAYDVVGRYGGEEFLVVLPDADAAEAAQVAERIRAAVRDRAILAEGHHLDITVSVGVASTGATFDVDAQRLIDAADQALYAAKAGGRDRVELAPPFAAG